MNGNSSNNVETYCSYNIYSFNQTFFSNCSLELTISPSPHYYSKEHSEKQDISSNHEEDLQNRESCNESKMIDILM